MSYARYDNILTGRCALRRKVANNTWAERRGDDRIAIRLHRTDVITFDRDGTVTLNTGGWYSVTTKERMNSFSPLSVWSHRGEWRVTTGGRWDDYVLYADGMTWHPETGFAGQLEQTDAQVARRERAKLNAGIKALVDSITPEQIVRAFDNAGGDCFICLAGGTSCLASHVEEQYFHAHLMLNAVKARGYRDPNFIMALIYQEAQRGHVGTEVTVNLTKYLRKNLIAGVAVR